MVIAIGSNNVSINYKILNHYQFQCSHRGNSAQDPAMCTHRQDSLTHTQTVTDIQLETDS